MIEQNIKHGRVKNFFSKYGLYLAIGFCVLFFATLIIIASVAGKQKEVIKKPDTPVNATVEFANPLMDATIYKNFNNENLVWNSTLKQWEAHMCVDLIATNNTSAMAIYDGVVKDIYSNYLEGTVVVIEHDNGLTSKIGSLSEDVLVKKGDLVKSGTKIGTASNTANREQNIGNYISLTLLDKSGKKVDPSNYLTLTSK